MRKWFGLLLATVALSLVATPAFASTSVYVSPAHTAQYYYNVGNTIKTWGYVTPKYAHIRNIKVTFYVYKKDSDGDYNLYKKVAGTLYNDSDYSYSTRDKATFAVHSAGKYRIKVKFTWTDSDGDSHTRWSSSHYIRATSD